MSNNNNYFMFYLNNNIQYSGMNLCILIEKEKEMKQEIACQKLISLYLQKDFFFFNLAQYYIIYSRWNLIEVRTLIVVV